MPTSEYWTVFELAAYGAILSSRSPVGNSTIFVILLQRVSENRFKSVYGTGNEKEKKLTSFVRDPNEIFVAERILTDSKIFRKALNGKTFRTFSSGFAFGACWHLVTI